MFNYKTSKYKFVLIFFTSFFLFIHSFAQSTLTIEECYALAKSPLIKQMEMLDKSKQYNIDNANKGLLPQINIYGQATYQSDVTEIKIPNVNTPSLSKDQYKIYAEVYQSLTDGNTVKIQKKLLQINAETEKQKIEIELYKLKDRINQMYFGILLMDAQIAQTELLKKDIQTGIDKTNAAIKNGTAIKNNSDLLLAEQLKADQRIIEFKANRKAFIDMLALFTKQNITETTKFQFPILQSISTTLNRPELKLFDFQKKAVEIQTKQISNRYIPKIGLFVQGGYGRPTLNFLKNDFTLYGIGGVKMNWNLSNLYTAKKDKQLLGISERSIEIQKETFLLNTNLVITQQNNEVNKYQTLIKTDSEIIAVRERIKKTANVQLSNGIISPLDFLTYLNAEDQAKQNLILHNIQMQLSQYNTQTTLGN
jgi:outer membrane protein TolC